MTKLLQIQPCLALNQDPHQRALAEPVCPLNQASVPTPDVLDSGLNSPPKPRLLEETRTLPDEGGTDLPSPILLLSMGASPSLISWVHGCNGSQLWLVYLRMGT